MALEYFAWNRTDLTQFTTTPIYTDGTGSPATSTMTLVALANRGNVIRLTGVGTGSNCIIWKVATPLVFPSLRRDFVIEVEVAQSTPGAGGYFGVAVLDHVGTVHALNHLAFGVAEWGSRVDNGASRSTNGTTGTTVGESGFARFIIQGAAQASLPPLLKSYLEGRGVGEIRGTGATADNDSPARGFSNNAVEGATWNGLATASIGLVLQSSGGNAPPTQVDILNFRAYDPLASGAAEAPTISAIFPDPRRLGPTDPFSFVVSNADLRTIIHIYYAALGFTEVAYAAGGFTRPYQRGSTVQDLGGGDIKYTVLRSPLWPDRPAPEVYAFAGGAEL